MTVAFEHPVVELIRTRTSSRAYQPGGSDAARLAQLGAYIEAANREAPAGVRLALVLTDAMAGEAPVKLGTYGVISGASSFILGIVDRAVADPVEFGRLFETVILRATDLGLGTCWLGGTFNRGDFTRGANLGENEWIPVVSPVGIARAQRSARETVMRTLVGANKRKPWSELFFADGGATPLDEAAVGEYATPLEMVRLGPSASNKQPWRVIADGDRYHFYISRTPGYRATGFDLQRSDIGIATCHFELSARELGLAGHWVTEPATTGPADWEYVTTWAAQAQ